MAQHYDVLIAGAGISGIAAAYHLKDKCPEKTFTVLEARDTLGGTWDLFRFPGIRSDSDMYTLGFSFRPWPKREMIGEGADILSYMRDTAAEVGIEDDIQLGMRIERASFSSSTNLWTVIARESPTGQQRVFTCNFFWSCMGYYRYDAGYTPDFRGTERFQGPIVHPQRWDEALDYTGKDVLVIGSGATAMTMIPVVARKARKVTMVQRSPTYVISWPRRSLLAWLLGMLLSRRITHRLIRWRNIKIMAGLYGFARRFPRWSRRILLRRARRELGPGFDVDTHFAPRYDPWDQRVCVVPDGDLFEAIRSGRADVATGDIDTFTERGLALTSGQEVEADIIVTATGFSLQWMGGIEIEVDGASFRPERSMIYKGCMLSGLPNSAFIFGYINSSWTLRAELVCEYVCGLLRLMDSEGYAQCRPRRDPEVEPLPAIELDAGYVRRGAGVLPVQGSTDPWRFHQSYALDRVLLLDEPIDDGVLELTSQKNAREDVAPRAPATATV